MSYKQILRHFFRSTFVSFFPNSVILRKLSFYPIEKTVDFKKSRFFQTRNDLYRYVNGTLLDNCAINYLEFGVFKGETIEFWSKLNNNPASNFVGFDTFTGLPEGWDSRGLPQGYFSTNGIAPSIDDGRVSFVKGLFQQTLPPFLASFKPAHRLVIHNDSDLYSSTLFTLLSLHPFMVNGTIIIFDEFNDVLDELRALLDYSSSFYINFEIVAHTAHYTQVAVLLTKNAAIYPNAAR